MSYQREPRPRHVAIVGSRDYPQGHWWKIERLVDGLEGCVIVSGHGGNADIRAEVRAYYRKHEGKMPTPKIHKANWNEQGRAAGPIRNTAVVGELKEGTTDELHAFVTSSLDERSGTADSVRKATRRGIPVTVHDDKCECGICRGGFKL